MEVDVVEGIGGRRAHAVVLALGLAGAMSCADGTTGPGSGEAPTITTSDLAAGAVGAAYGDVLTATGGLAPYAWEVTAGFLPAGLGLDGSSGVISGVPTGEGTSDFTVRVTGNDGLGSTKALSLAVGPGTIVPLSVPLSDGVVGVPYTLDLRAAGGDGAYGWTITSGSLPSGLSLTGSTISGQPIESGFFPLGMRVESGEKSSDIEDRIRVYATEELQRLLEHLPGFIETSIEHNQEMLPRNPHLASQIRAKTALLSAPDLEASILNGTLFETRETTTLDGRAIPVAIVFPADSMRAGALADLELVPATVRVLEELLNVPWPQAHVYEWYGFRLGHGGGGGSLYMEDRGTYAERGAPHDVIVAHELGHSYIGHEGLTQFLEVYGYNVVETGSTDFSTWTWMREIGGAVYEPFAARNDGAWALMDIYQLIGPEAMGRAYARIQALGAPYGTRLGVQARQAFVDEAPASARAQVEAIVPRV